MADKKDFGAAFGEYAGERLGRPVDRIVTGTPEPKEKQLTLFPPEDDRLNVRINSELKKDFEAAAAAEGLKPSSAVKKLVKQYVDNWKASGGSR